MASTTSVSSPRETSPTFLAPAFCCADSVCSPRFSVVQSLVAQHLRSRLEGEGRGRTIEEATHIICSYLGSEELVNIHLDLFLPSYKITIFRQGASWKGEDIFLLGEDHNSGEEAMWRPLNGLFISLLSRIYPLTVFLEAWPSMERPTDPEEDLRHHYFIDSPNPRISFYGWDESDELMEPSREMSRGVTASMKEYNKLKAQARACQEELEGICPGFSEDNTELLLALPMGTLGKIHDKVLRRKALLETCRVMMGKIEKLDRVVSEQITTTFPARTRAMISTLRRVQQLMAEGAIQGKVVMIAGAAHLDRTMHPNSKERSLAALYAELCSKKHKAAVMIPAIERRVSDWERSRTSSLH